MGTKVKKTTIVIAVLSILAIICMYLDLSWVTGRELYTPNEVIDTILGGGTLVSQSIILDTNAPRVAIGIFVGMGLAVAGCAMQAVFRNPPASPYILGLSSGASVGAAVSMLVTIPLIPMGIVTPVLAFVTCFLTMIIVYSMSRIGGSVRTESLILSGVAVSSLLSAIVSFLTYIAGDKLEGIVFWTMGNLSNADWAEIGFIAPIILMCGIFLVTQAKGLNAMMLGDVHALDLGIDVKKTRLFVLILATIIVASAVSFTGVIGFIGLVIPHILRIILGPDNRVIMPLSMFAGASFVLICDFISHIIIPAHGTLPIGVVTALIGAPVFIYLLISKKKEVGWN
jgi:iron complex transport system permease protein